MATTTQVEVWVLVDENGDAVSSCDPDCLSDLYEEHIGSDHATGRRVVKVVLTVPLPKPVELSGVVPADEGEATLAVV
jgi:hypothetical protein